MADIHLPIDDWEDIWEPDGAGINEVPNMSVEPPPIEDFLKVVKEVYHVVKVNAGFTEQALIELKQWKESLITREAQ